MAGQQSSFKHRACVLGMGAMVLLLSGCGNRMPWDDGIDQEMITGERRQPMLNPAPGVPQAPVAEDAPGYVGPTKQFPSGAVPASMAGAPVGAEVPVPVPAAPPGGYAPSLSSSGPGAAPMPPAGVPASSPSAYPAPGGYPDQPPSPAPYGYQPQSMAPAAPIAEVARVDMPPPPPGYVVPAGQMPPAAGQDPLMATMSNPAVPAQGYQDPQMMAQASAPVPPQQPYAPQAAAPQPAPEDPSWNAFLEMPQESANPEQFPDLANVPPAQPAPGEHYYQAETAALEGERRAPTHQFTQEELAALGMSEQDAMAAGMAPTATPQPVPAAPQAPYGTTAPAQPIAPMPHSQAASAAPMDSPSYAADPYANSAPAPAMEPTYISQPSAPQPSYGSYDSAPAPSIQLNRPKPAYEQDGLVNSRYTKRRMMDRRYMPY